MTCLSLIQDAAVLLGLEPPATIVAADTNSRLLLRLANVEGRALMRRHDWQALTVERTFTSLATVEQTGFIPSAFDRFVYNAEVWDRTRSLKFAGPTPSRVWQDLQTNLTGGIVGWWRMLAGELNIFPAQEAGNTLAFEYISKNWARSSADAEKEAFTEDTDTSVLREDLIMMGIMWRFGAPTKSFDYAEHLATYEREVELATSRDRGMSPIYPPPGQSTMPPVPTWPGTITVP